MVQQRSVALAVVLAILTCGIYGIYWFIVLTNDIGRISGDPSFTGGKHFLLGLITCGIWYLVWAYQASKHVSEAQRQRGFMYSDNAVLHFVLCIFGFSIITYALLQSEVNKIAV